MEKNQDLLFIVPARQGSKRLPGKNIRKLGPYTLLEWTAQAIIKSGIDAPVLLTTDSPEIAKLGQNLGWNTPFLRPSDLAQDTTPMNATIIHALDWWRQEKGKDPGLIMLLQPTSPFRNPDDIVRAITIFKKRHDVDAVVSVTCLKFPKNDLYTLDKEGFGVSLNPTGTELEPVYIENGALYLVRTSIFRLSKKFFPEKTLPLITEDKSSLDIDTPLDWAIAEKMAEEVLIGFPKR